jgi:hypothetical protein
MTELSQDGLPKHKPVLHISCTVPQYFSTDKVARVVEACRSHRVRFCDPEFRPTAQSWLGTTKEGLTVSNLKLPGNLEWARVSAVLGEEEFSVFSTISPQSFRQGQINDGLFLGTLAAIAERPTLIKRLFESEDTSNEGIYCIWLFIDGLWREIVIDDFLPLLIEANTCEFATSRTSEDDIWLFLLQKAYAKARGGYSELSRVSVPQILRELTGAPVSKLTQVSADADGLWRELTEACDKNYIIVGMGKATTSAKLKPQELLPFTIVDCAEVYDSYGRPAQLVLLRSCWGEMLQMQWGVNSPLWTKEMKNRLIDFEAEDCLQWFSLQDLVSFIEEVYICRVENDYVWNGTKVRNEGNQHMVRVDVATGGDFILCLDQRYLHRPSYFRVTYGKLEEGDVRFVSCKLSSNHLIFSNLQLTEGKYIILIDSYWTASPHTFSVSLYGTGHTTLNSILPNQSEYHRAEYLLWKDYSTQARPLFTKQGSYTLGEGFLTSSVLKLNLQDMHFGLSINRWEVTSGKATLVKAVRAENTKGIEMCSEDGGNGINYLTVGPSRPAVEIFKLDPREDNFCLNQKAVGFELLESAFQAYYTTGLANVLLNMPQYSSIHNRLKNVLQPQIQIGEDRRLVQDMMPTSGQSSQRHSILRKIQSANHSTTSGQPLKNSSETVKGQPSRVVSRKNSQRAPLTARDLSTRSKQQTTPQFEQPPNTYRSRHSQAPLPASNNQQPVPPLTPQSITPSVSSFYHCPTHPPSQSPLLPSVHPPSTLSQR